jgi:hypothetical protein
MQFGLKEQEVIDLMRTGVLFHPVSECGANVFKVENKT